MIGALRASLPTVVFVSLRYLSISDPLVVAATTTAVLPDPSVGRGSIIDASGFNTLSVLATVSGVTDTLKVIVSAVDPETGAQVVGNLADATIIDTSTDGSFAGTLYLPAYYAGLSGLIMPFDQLQLNLVNTGGSDVTVTALKGWLTNA